MFDAHRRQVWCTMKFFNVRMMVEVRKSGGPDLNLCFHKRFVLW